MDTLKAKFSDGEMSDQELARAVLAGDEAAALAFDRRYRPRLYKAAVYFLGYRDPEAEDAVQETFEAALKNLGRYDASRGSLYTWMAHICVNACLKKIRARRRLVLGQEEEMESLIQGESLRRHQAAEKDQEGRERAAEVEKFIGSLGAACRDVLRLRHQQGESYAGMARALRVPLGTVMSRLARCREELKKKLSRVRGGVHG